jgi:hypothetical protein
MSCKVATKGRDIGDNKHNMHIIHQALTAEMQANKGDAS